ncbi:unnamed protein product [Caenorhabditis brenneri]
MENQKIGQEEIQNVIQDIQASIDIIQKVPELMRKEKKDYLYTDDPEYKQMFQNCKNQHGKITKSTKWLLENISRLGNDETKLKKNIEDLEEQVNGFFLMVSESEVEHSTIVYAEGIKFAFQNLSDTLLHSK